MITLKQLLEKLEEADKVEGHEFKEDVTPMQRKNYAGVYQHFIRPIDQKAGAFVHASSMPKHIASHLRKYGSASLVGSEANTPHDLATLAQIHRDPRVESLHMIYTKGNKVVGHNTVSSRMPGMVMPFRFGENPTSRFMSMQDDMKHFGADGYYLLHNHPSGRSTPSTSDVRLTQAFHESLPGMKSHIVINNSEYHTISPDGNDIQHHQLSHPIHYDLENPDHHLKHHPVVGMQILNEKHLADVGKHFEDPSHITLIGTYGASGKVNSVVGMPPHLLENNKATTDRIHHFARHAGSSRQFLIVPHEKDMWDFAHHIRNGTVTDVVARDTGKSAAQLVGQHTDSSTRGIPIQHIKRYGSISNRDDF